MDQINLLSIVIAGVTTGGLSCFAVQGGLLTSAMAHTKGSQAVPVIAFILAKLFAYAAIGAALGAFGSIFNLTSNVQAIIQVIIALYMLGVAANLVNIHPIFRYFIFQPPYFLQRAVRKVSKGSADIATPTLLGLLTIAIPCGTTLAMQALAIASGSAWQGMLIMATFVVSSSWVFLALGFTARHLNQSLQNYFYKITAVTLVVLAGVSLNSGLNLLGFPYTLDTLLNSNQITPAQAAESTKPFIEYERQKVSITIDSRGYTASTQVLRKDVPVELTLESRNSYSCANAFAIPSLSIIKVMPENGSETIVFTPTQPGRLVYSCSMGMFRGEFFVL